MPPQLAIGQLAPTRIRGAWCAGAPLIRLAVRLSLSLSHSFPPSLSCLASVSVSVPALYLCHCVSLPFSGPSVFMCGYFSLA